MTKQHIQEQIAIIQNLIAKGETVQAIEALRAFTTQLNNDDYRDTALAISGYKHDFLKKEMTALLSESELSIKKNSINQKILLLLTQIEDEQVEGKQRASTPLAHSKKKNNSLWWVAGGAVIVVVAILYLLMPSGGSESSVVSSCDVLFEKAKVLFEKGDYATARLAFLEIKTDNNCTEKIELADEYIRLCNDKDASDGFKLLKIDINATPKSHQGDCPVDVVFSGKIFTNQNTGTLQYCLDFNGKEGTNCLPITIKSGVAAFQRSYQFNAEELQKKGEEINVSVMVIDDSQKAHRGGKVTLNYQCN